MYVCGVTPYDTTHLGHARTFVVFDVLARLLETRGQRVRYAQTGDPTHPVLAGRRPARRSEPAVAPRLRALAPGVGRTDLAKSLWPWTSRVAPRMFRDVRPPPRFSHRHSRRWKRSRLSASRVRDCAERGRARHEDAIRRSLGARGADASWWREDVEVRRQHGLCSGCAEEDLAAGPPALPARCPLPTGVRPRRGPARTRRPTRGRAGQIVGSWQARPDRERRLDTKCPRGPRR